MGTILLFVIGIFVIAAVVAVIYREMTGPEHDPELFDSDALDEAGDRSSGESR